MSNVFASIVLLCCVRVNLSKVRREEKQEYAKEVASVAWWAGD
jgi:hypothetical protein